VGGREGKMTPRRERREGEKEGGREEGREGGREGRRTYLEEIHETDLE